MHKDVRPIHPASQNRLNGKPRITGSTRSQSDTEKHTATNGMSARTTAGADTFLTSRIPRTSHLPFCEGAVHTESGFFAARRYRASPSHVDRVLASLRPFPATPEPKSCQPAVGVGSRVDLRHRRPDTACSATPRNESSTHHSGRVPHCARHRMALARPHPTVSLARGCDHRPARPALLLPHHDDAGDQRRCLADRLARAQMNARGHEKITYPGQGIRNPCNSEGTK
jgi:hypothetical protein